MSLDTTILLAGSLIGLIIGVAAIELRRGKSRRVLPGILIIAFAVGVFLLTRPANVETKGAVDETAGVVFCYGAMLLGMFAEYGYRQAERGETRFKFELMQFLMPVFASPIVFIPLLTITDDLPLGGAFTKAKLMVYLVAFQNGFFWKSFFEQRRQHILETGTSLPASEPQTELRSLAKSAGKD
jgi:hypothetical protein